MAEQSSVTNHSTTPQKSPAVGKTARPTAGGQNLRRWSSPSVTEAAKKTTQAAAAPARGEEEEVCRADAHWAILGVDREDHAVRIGIEVSEPSLAGEKSCEGGGGSRRTLRPLPLGERFGDHPETRSEPLIEVVIEERREVGLLIFRQAGAESGGVR